MSLAEVFPTGDFRFHLTLRRGEPREFFARRDHTGRLLAERARWLASDPANYAAVTPEGEGALREFAAMSAPWAASAVLAAQSSLSPNDLVRAVGRELEPDILFLSADESGQFRLRGGALCFPTGWALQEKLGHTLEFIHGVVPGLNPALGAPIQQFLSRLRPGTAFMRDNWGLAATNDLNLHPARGIKPPEPPVNLERLWLRVEHQALFALPDSRGIVFGIRIALHRMDQVRGGADAGLLRRALETMPSEVIAYKRLEGIRGYLLNVLE